MIDLAVVGQDPAFGGGAHAQMEAFLAAARSLGREPELLYVPHPTFHPESRASPFSRIETLRLLSGSPRLVRRLRKARSVWAVAPLAMHGLAALLSKRPYVCWAVTSLTAENTGRRVGLPLSRQLALRVNAPALRQIERRVLGGATRVYATGASSRHDVARAGDFDPARIGVLPLPVDSARFVPEPDERWIARLDTPVVAFVGRGDDPRKNLALALDALPLLRQRVPGARLRIIGPGSVPPRDAVELLGEVESVAEPLREASLLLLPSRQEGFGIVAAEALASGVPVLATPCGGPEELLRMSGGGRITTGFDPAEFADVAAELLTDTQTLVRMRRAGREYVAHEHSAERLARLVGEVLDGLPG